MKTVSSNIFSLEDEKDTTVNYLPIVFEREREREREREAPLSWNFRIGLSGETVI